MFNVCLEKKLFCFAYNKNWIVECVQNDGNKLKKDIKKVSIGNVGLKMPNLNVAIVIVLCYFYDTSTQIQTLKRNEKYRKLLSDFIK